MPSSFLSYLRHNVLSDERIINRLFVSMFIENNHLKNPSSDFLSSYLIKKDDADYEILKDVLKHLMAEYGKRLLMENLVNLFEYVVSPADRIVTGAIYTPSKVREAIISKCIDYKNIKKLSRIRVADISCGCGGFLLDVAQLIHKKTGKSYADIFKENIYGIDLQEYAIERTKISLSLLALCNKEDTDFCFNLLCMDTLDYASDHWDDTYKEFDVIVGNPPYVCSRNLLKETYVKLQRFEVCRTGHPDLYIPFFQIAIEMLKDKGHLGYITMNTFLRSVNGRALRKYFSRNRFQISIVDFRGFQIFESKNTYTCLFFLKKEYKRNSIRYSVDDEGSLTKKLQFKSILYDDLDDVKGWTLNEFDRTKAIESTGIQIKDYCPSRHGIATLCNQIYIFKSIEEDKYCYYLESEGKKYPIEKGICRRAINPNKLNSTVHLENAIEVLIFPYRIENGHARIFEPEEMKQQFPLTLAYLKTKKRTLMARDKGKTNTYPQWYAFGRTQSLILPRYKLFFPKFAMQPLQCVIYDDPELMLYNGLAFVNANKRKLTILKTIIESQLFWHYVQTNGKPYASGYYSLSGVDIKHFGIPKFTSDEEDELLSMTDKEDIEIWLRKRYNID